MYDFHADRNRYFLMQYHVAQDALIPFIEQHKKITPNLQVLDIGCGECGVLKAFLERGCTATGIELDTARLKDARLHLSLYTKQQKLELLSCDIYDVDTTLLQNRFDIIILKDVIEHIHDQSKLLGTLRSFLTEGGMIFFAFPPWQMPFGGHQQMCSSWISKLPYIHLLPREWYKWLLQQKNEPVEALMEVRDTRLSIDRFDMLLHHWQYTTVQKQLYLFNPIYRYKFGFPPLQQNRWLARIPVLRNYISTCAYYLVQNSCKFQYAPTATYLHSAEKRSLVNV
jgi:cyclopropane fatty-acyl-phospholipid synthase-like methyltransferase